MASETQPIRSVKPITVGGAVVSPGRIFNINNCTVAGAVVVTLQDGTSKTFTPAVGDNSYPYSVRAVVSSAATATSYENGY